MKQKTIIIVAILFVFGEIKSIDPLSAFFGACITFAAFFKKTKTGGVLAKYAQLKIAQSSVGKGLVSYSENCAKDIVRRRVQRYHGIVAALIQNKIECVRGKIGSGTPCFFKTPRETSFQTTVNKAEGMESGAGQCFQSIQDLSACFLSPRQTVNVQSNIHQEIKVGPGAFFSYIQNDPSMVQKHAERLSGQHGKAQFWKGAFFGAMVMGYMEKRKKDEISEKGWFDQLVYGEKSPYVKNDFSKSFWK